MAPVTAKGRNHAKESGKSPKPFPKNRPGWIVSGPLAPTLAAPGSPNTPRQPRRDQRLVLIVTENLGVDSSIRCVEPGCLRCGPISVYPSAVNFKCDSWRKQPDKGPIEAIVDNISTVHRMIETGKAG